MATVITTSLTTHSVDRSTRSQRKPAIPFRLVQLARSALFARALDRRGYPLAFGNLRLLRAALGGVGSNGHLANTAAGGGLRHHGIDWRAHHHHRGEGRQLCLRRGPATLVSTSLERHNASGTVGYDIGRHIEGWGFRFQFSLHPLEFRFLVSRAFTYDGLRWFIRPRHGRSGRVRGLRHWSLLVYPINEYTWCRHPFRRGAGGAFNPPTLAISAPFAPRVSRMRRRKRDR